jgi:predicted dehydrogenase
MSDVRIGVVGTGYLGRLHARVITELTGATAVGFVEPNDAIAAEVSAILGLRRFDSVAALAREVDCAVVVTPTTTHGSVATELIEAGCDVLVEKPITATVEEAQALIELATARGRVLQVGHVERYNPAIVAIAPHVRDTRYFVAERIGVFSGRSLDIDVLLDLMIHDLNLVLSLFGQRVVDVQAVGVPVLTDKVDMTNVRLELENGAVANLTASRVSQERVRKQRFFGGDFYMSIDTKEQEAHGYRLVNRSGAPKLEPIELAIEKKEPLRAELEAFLQCVRDRSRPLVSGEDGLEAVALAKRVATAIERSLGRWRG